MIVYKNNPLKFFYCFDVRKYLLICSLCSIPKTFWALGTSFMEDSFSMDWGEWRWGIIGDDSNVVHLLCTLFLLLLHQLHLRFSHIRSQRFGLPIRRDSLICWSSDVWYIKLNFSPLYLLPGTCKWE